MTSSVIICTRNRPHDVVRMLTSLANQTTPPTQIIIIDSSTTALDLVVEFRQQFAHNNFPDSQLVYQHTEPGLTYQRNRGIKLATSSITYFFDDDVVLSPTYLYEMQKIFEQYPHYMGGMGNVHNIGHYKPWINLLRACFFLQRNYAAGKFTLSGAPTHAYGNKYFQTVEVLGGCCMAFKTSILQQQQFDENLRFYSYMEDVDISYRISQNALLFYNPTAVLKHLESPINRDKLIDNKAMFIANYTYLFFKNVYPHNRLKLIAYCWSIVGLFLEAGLIVRNKTWLKGYWRGLRHAIKSKARPYTL